VYGLFIVLKDLGGFVYLAMESRGKILQYIAYCFQREMGIKEALI